MIRLGFKVCINSTVPDVIPPSYTATNRVLSLSHTLFASISAVWKLRDVAEILFSSDETRIR